MSYDPLMDSVSQHLRSEEEANASLPYTDADRIEWLDDRMNEAPSNVVWEALGLDQNIVRLRDAIDAAMDAER